MTTMYFGSLLKHSGGIRGGQSDFKYLARACGHASLQSRRERRPGGATYPRRVSRKPFGDRNLRSQTTRPAAARYGELPRPRTATGHISRNLTALLDLIIDDVAVWLAAEYHAVHGAKTPRT